MIHVDTYYDMITCVHDFKKSHILSVTLNRGTRAHLILGCADHTCVTYLVEKPMYFIHVDQNPMNYNPNFTT